MVGQTFFNVYYIAVYIWFVIGILLIGIPAVKEIFRTLTKKR